MKNWWFCREHLLQCMFASQHAELRVGLTVATPKRVALPPTAVEQSSAANQGL
jgi:hypothetical protein